MAAGLLCAGLDCLRHLASAPSQRVVNDEQGAGWLHATSIASLGAKPISDDDVANLIQTGASHEHIWHRDTASRPARPR